MGRGPGGRGPGGSRRRVAAAGLVVVLLGAVTACGVPGADRDRAEAEARTCRSFLRRTDRPAAVIDAVDPDVFLATRVEVLRTGKPFSTLEPFLRACRSFD